MLCYVYFNIGVAVVKSFFSIRQAIKLGIPVTKQELSYAQDFAKNRREGNNRVVNVVIISSIIAIICGLTFRT